VDNDVKEDVVTMQASFIPEFKDSLNRVSKRNIGSVNVKT